VRFRLLILVTLAAIFIAGCGGETYDDVLQGLRGAALSGKTYNAIRHADDLDASQKAVVNAFCNIATQLADNEEAITTEQYFDQIQADATREAGFLEAKAVETAVTRLRAIYDLSSINGHTATLYVNACYR